MARAIEDGGEWSEMWRHRYSLPLTDPRWLDATEAIIMEDLIRVKRCKEVIERLVDPEKAAADDANKAFQKILENETEKPDYVVKAEAERLRQIQRITRIEKGLPPDPESQPALKLKLKIGKR